jgi:hypothetical protein
LCPSFIAFFFWPLSTTWSVRIAGKRAADKDARRIHHAVVQASSRNEEMMKNVH